jgi:hypothetical protein
MSVLIPGWETGRIASIAPDEASVKAARRLILPGYWTTLGTNRVFAWGTVQGSSGKPYQVMLDLSSLTAGPLTYRCTCPSRKQPCKHVLALLLIAGDNAGALVRHPEPAPFVAEWLQRRAEKSGKAARPKKAPSPGQQEKSAAARRAKIASGLDELEPWLFDLVRQGLGDARLRSRAFWEARAARLIDAQAPGIASRLRTLALGGVQRADYNAWVDAALQSLGQIDLMVRGFGQIDQLPAPLQADLRTALGWPLRQEELAEEPAVQDRWLVLGRREELVEQQLRQQRIWLLGLETGRFALILEFAFGNTGFETSLQPGEAIDAGLVFYPSGTPLRAFARESKPVAVGQVSNLTAGLETRPTSAGTALAGYAAALAANPWLLQYPFLLGPVWPQPAGESWLLRDEAVDTLPLAAHFPHGWSLLALSGGQPLAIFGEWNGDSLLPQAALAGGRLVDLARLEAR